MKGSDTQTVETGALRSVVESDSIYNAFYNPAFVLLEYYGYLRRNPNAAPDNNFEGYNFWLADGLFLAAGRKGQG